MACIIFNLAILTLLLGFIGLVVLIYGFRNNNLGNIKKGSVLFSISLILFVTMSFLVAKKAVRHYKYRMHSMEKCMQMNEQCKSMMENDCSSMCDEGMSMTGKGDSTIVIIEKKVIK